MASSSAANRSRSIGAPSIRARSVIACKWGLVWSPVRLPAACNAAAIIVEVELFPLVPPTWTVR